MLTDVVSYTTSCGTGEFTYEPYPVVLQPGQPQPPIYPILSDASCVSPGSTIEIHDFARAYPDVAQIQRLDLAILHTRYDPNAAGAGVWVCGAGCKIPPTSRSRSSSTRRMDRSWPPSRWTSPASRRPRRRSA